jgi:hypothetical protein
MGPEPGLDAKNSPAKTTRSHTEIVKGTETVGVCTGAFTRALNPLDTADFVRDVLLKPSPLLRGNPDAADEILESRVGAPGVVVEGYYV